MAAPPPPNAPPKIVRKRTVLLLGKSQVGKSHLCNVVFTRPRLFAEGNLIASQTRSPFAETFVYFNAADNIEYAITMVDTPGLFDSRPALENSELLGSITDFVRNKMESVDRIFYVFRVGPITEEEVKCLELVRSLLSEEAIDSGICSLVVTHCDRMSACQRDDVVAGIKESKLGPWMPMFTRKGQDQPEILTADFSHDSTTLADDRASVIRSICTAEHTMHKSSCFRLFKEVEKAERAKIRAAWVATIPQDLKVEKDGRSICPIQ
eukprot:TRINITY_DN703_c0_g1_i1.p1 TRINITY_DN703_c0_g1~~TRINITY_DN703_c0_g1_i1.p1  ORF type:complete len:266 (-),score=22.18 TRINITY_DN703_c0_g1_i1:61-858(-)